MADDERDDRIKRANRPKRYVNTRDYVEPDGRLVKETTYVQTGKGPFPTDLVFRGRNDDFIEEIPRDFPPPRRQGMRSDRRYRDDRYDDDYDDRYERRYDRRFDYDDEYFSDEERDDRYRRPKGPRGRGSDHYLDRREVKKDKPSPESDKPTTPANDNSLTANINALKDKVLGRDTTDNKYVDNKGRSSKWAQAAQAAGIAAAVEAFISRSEPGPWTGSKGRRVATAALSAGGVDAFVSGKHPEEKTKRHLFEAVVAGILTTRAVNGARDKGDGYYDDDGVYQPRGRSTSVFGRMRSRSRRRSMSRGDGYYSDEEHGAERGRRGVDMLTGAGIGYGVRQAYKAFKDRSRSKRRTSGSRSRSRGRRQSQESQSRSSSASSFEEPDRRGSSDNYGKKNRAREASRGRDQHKVRSSLAATGAGAGAGALATNTGARSKEIKQSDIAPPYDHERSLSTSSSDMSDIEQKRKHLRGKELLTAGLATIATIHAANGVYSSMAAHEKRHKLVNEGKMSVAEARKKQTKAWIQDAAAVGIAALGIKGAFSEWQSMNEQRNEQRELEKRKREKEKRAARRKAQREREREIRLAQISQLPALLMNHPALQTASQLGIPKSGAIPQNMQTAGMAQPVPVPAIPQQQYPPPPQQMNPAY